MDRREIHSNEFRRAGHSGSGTAAPACSKCLGMFGSPHCRRCLIAEGLELVIAGDCVSPQVVQHHVQILPRGASLDPEDVVNQAAARLAQVMSAAANTQPSDITLHIWSCGPPVKCSRREQAGLPRRYRSAFRDAISVTTTVAPATKRLKIRREEWPRGGS